MRRMKKRLHIALVEDNKFHAMLFEQAIRERHPEFTVTVYTTGRGFLRHLRESQDDLIAVDFNLPDLDGLHLLSLIRAEKPDIPIILITGVGSEQTAVEAMKSGATDYITKDGNYGSAIPRVVKQAYQKQRLIRRNRRLEATAREAEKLEMITAMASTLNHEINNPLMAILGNVELLLDDGRIGDAEIRGKLRMVEMSARRIQAITHRMANLMTTSIRQTAAGPMLKLRSAAAAGSTPKTRPDTVSLDKSN